jgi:hypothetical protein
LATRAFVGVWGRGGGLGSIDDATNHMNAARRGAIRQKNRPIGMACTSPRYACTARSARLGPRPFELAGCGYQTKPFMPVLPQYVVKCFVACNGRDVASAARHDARERPDSQSSTVGANNKAAPGGFPEKRIAQAVPQAPPLAACGPQAGRGGARGDSCVPLQPHMLLPRGLVVSGPIFESRPGLALRRQSCAVPGGGRLCR